MPAVAGRWPAHQALRYDAVRLPTGHRHNTFITSQTTYDDGPATQLYGTLPGLRCTC